jgi:hypothetical protein
MAHPNGGQGAWFNPQHSFEEAYAFVGSSGVGFLSTTNEHIQARRGLARDRVTPTIAFQGERTRQGSACKSCWGFRVNCNQTRIGQCAEALDSAIKRTSAVKHSFDGGTSTVGLKGTRHVSPISSEVSADELARVRRSLLRLLDAVEHGRSSSEGLVGRATRLSRAGIIPREIAALMRVVAEMRNASEYQAKKLNANESLALRSSWSAILEWAAKANVPYKE